jgi:hypothetical protein
VRFATLALDEDQIKSEVLTNPARIQEFKDAFNLFRDKHEFGLRARWKDVEKVFKKISTLNERVLRAKEEALKGTGEKKHLALIEVGHIVKEALEEEKKKLAREFRESLESIAHQYKEPTVWGDANIFNIIFLVSDSSQDLFDATINELVKKYEDNILFKYVGPTPAYNFIEIVIHFSERNGA